jgi:hypothetical protein
MRAISYAEHILNKKTVIYEILLAVFLIAVALSVYFIMEGAKSQGSYVVVSINGENVGTYSLNENGRFLLNGGTNELVIIDGSAYISSADCPDKLCVHQGKISKIGERIVCLPNRIIIEVVSEQDEIFAS